MKFTDGYWRLRNGFTVLRPVEVESVHLTNRTMTVYWTTRPLRHRDDVTNMALLSTEYSSPAEGIIRVRHVSREGVPARGPSFAIPHSDTHPLDIVDGPDWVEFATGDLRIRIRKAGPRLVQLLRGDHLLSTMDTRSGGIITAPDGRRYTHEQLELAPGETVYGLGERFGPIVRNGQSVEMWNIDSGTSSEMAYKNVPFYWTSQGYGVIVDSPARVSFEIASEAVSRSQFSVEGETLDYLVLDGPTPKGILQKYTTLLGSSPRIPAWSFGLWLSSSFTTDYDADTVLSFVDGMTERGIPLSVFHFDSYWMRRFHWCDFIWDPETFPNPRAFLADLKSRGVRVCVWINPYIAQRSHLFAEGAANGYLLTRPDGSIYQTDYWQNGMGIVDFTNPEATAWYTKQLAALLDMGVDAFKTDFGEEIPTDVIWHDGSDPARMHNYYPTLYNGAVFRLLQEARGDGEALLFSRSATLGGHQYPVHWGGDCQSSFAGMQESLRGGLSLAASGFSYWSHDIGGFEGRPDPAVFKRWVAFGLLSSHSRLHGSTSYRVPWEFDDEAVEITRSFAALKRTLTPYLLAAADEAHTTGTPILRPMALEFPTDPTCRPLETQYMLGGDILVAPVLTLDGTVTYYLPEGLWTHLIDGRTLPGGQWHTETYGFESVPVFVRPGTILPTITARHQPDSDWANDVTLNVFRPEAGFQKRTRVVDAAGTTVLDATVTITASKPEVTVHIGIEPAAVIRVNTLEDSI